MTIVAAWLELFGGDPRQVLRMRADFCLAVLAERRVRQGEADPPVRDVPRWDGTIERRIRSMDDLQQLLAGGQQ